MKQLTEGYGDWREFADKKRLTGPCPIEFLDETGKYRVLTDIITAYELQAIGGIN